MTLRISIAPSGFKESLGADEVTENAASLLTHAAERVMRLILVGQKLNK